MFEEQYGDDDAPLSPFSGAFKFYYDHDYLETGGGGGLQPVEEVFRDGSYIETYRDAVIEAAHAKGLTHAGGAALLYDHVYLVGKTKVRQALGYTFLGVFDFKRG